MRRIKDISGQRFGMLTAIEVAPKVEKRQIAWRCICDCGKECVTRGTALRFGHVKSCGCLSGKGVESPDYLRSIVKWAFRICLGGAKSRNLSFKLNESQFLEIIQKPCHYCGDGGRNIAAIWYQEKISRVVRGITAGHDERASKTVLIANGVDRHNSSKGYSTDNCVPCCTNCNMMKKALSENEFLSHIKKIAKYRKLI